MIINIYNLIFIHCTKLKIKFIQKLDGGNSTNLGN